MEMKNGIEDGFSVVCFLFYKGPFIQAIFFSDALLKVVERMQR